MKKLPSAGGEPDIAQMLQVTPGVIFTGDQGGQLYIRGGAPSQTGILLDGVTIYNPFHTIGLYSVFETDAIRSVDVYSAGFNAQYGDRTSAILDIRTKDGNKNRLSGKLSASPVMARAMLEGPISKPKTDDGSSTTFLLSVKHSYLDQTSKPLYGGFSEIFNNGLPYSFTDLYGKVSFNGGNGSKLNVFGFDFDDRAKFLQPNTAIDVADYKWNAIGAGATFVLSPSGSSALIDGKFAYSKYNINYAPANSLPQASGINGFEAGINFTNFLPGYSQFKYGLQVSGFHTSLDYYNEYNTHSTLDRQNTEAALFATFRKDFGGKLIIEPGLRLQYYAALSKLSPEPRIGLKYNITDNIRLKAAAGLYSQALISTKSDRDIVNFFSGFLLSPDQTIYDQNGNAINNNLQTAYHVAGGVEVDVHTVEINLEPWFKNFTRVIELNRDKIQSSDPDYQAGTGKAYGLDLSAKYSKGRFYLWTAFSLQHVTNTYLIAQSITSSNGVLTATSADQTFATPYDRRFNMNLLASYDLGKHREWEVSLRYNLGSPFPFTQTQGFYENLNLANGGLTANNLTQNGQVGLIYANEVNGGRLSWYHRVDASVRRRFRLTKLTNIEATLSVTNVLNRENIFYVDRIGGTRVYQLPLFPSLNITWNF